MIRILDLGINNLGSLTRAFSSLGESPGVFDVEVLSKPAMIGRKDLLVLPGTGSFAAGMERIRSLGFEKYLKDEASGGTKILGICLGMQLLGLDSEESPGTTGLGIVPAR